MHNKNKPSRMNSSTILILVWLLISGPYFLAEAQITKPKKAGDRAPEFSLTTLDGEVLTCDSLDKKTWVLNFFTYDCEVCLEELPIFETDIWQRYRDRNINIVAIGRKHTFSELRSFRDSTQYTFPMAPDSDRTVFRKFANIMIPRNIIIGKDGIIKFHIVGMNEYALEEMIRIIEAELIHEEEGEKSD